MKRSSRSTPTGPGSRGGTVPHSARRHRDGSLTTPEQRAAHAAYAKAWRAANPEYREREALRKARLRATARGEDAALVVSPPCRAARLTPADLCRCSDCECREPVVVVCGFCVEGLHGE